MTAGGEKPGSFPGISGWEEFEPPDPPTAAGGQTGPRQLLHCFLSKQSADVWRQIKIETEKDADLKYSHVVKTKIRTKLISQTYKIKKVKELLMHLIEEYI